MHPARLRIHPARPGGGSRAPGAGPSGRLAPRLPGGPGGDTGGRAPGLPRSFHFKSTLRKFAKLVSRWLLRASREGVAHQPAVAADLGGSRWLLRGLDRAAWEAGRARGGTRAALPERDGPHCSAETPAAGCCLGGALGQRPQRPRSPRPWPGPAPPPAPPRIVRPLGEPARRCAPGGSLWRRGGAAAAGAAGRAHSPAASPPGLPWGQGRRSRAGKGGRSGVGGRLVPWPPVRRWLHSPGAESNRSPPPHPGNADPWRPPPGLDRQGRVKGAEAPGRGQLSSGGCCLGGGGGGGYRFTAICPRLKCLTQRNFPGLGYSIDD